MTVPLPIAVAFWIVWLAGAGYLARAYIGIARRRRARRRRLVLAEKMLREYRAAYPDFDRYTAAIGRLHRRDFK